MLCIFYFDSPFWTERLEKMGEITLPPKLAFVLYIHFLSAHSDTYLDNPYQRLYAIPAGFPHSVPVL